MATVFRENLTQELVLTQSLSLGMLGFEALHMWPRWINASIYKHFEDRKGDFEIYIEGDERTLTDNEFVEVRIDGPFIERPHKFLFYLNVQINVLVQAHIDPIDLYKQERIAGIFLKAFTNTINVNKLGDGVFDDGTLLECLHLQRDKKEGVAMNNFGIIRPDTRITQATIEGHYRLELWNQGA